MRVLPMLALTVAVLALPTIAYAQGDDISTAPIVGGDSTLSGLTGHVQNPEAYTQGTESGAVGLNLIFPEGDQAGDNAWVPTFVWGVDDKIELGGFGWIQDGENVDDTFGFSAKWKFYDERAGSDLVSSGSEEPAEGGFPSMAGYYTYTGSGDITTHRLGLVASWTFDEETDDAEFQNSTFSAGAIYNFIDDSSTGTQLDENDFDWFVGAVLRPDDAFSISLEYEDNDDDGFVSEGFAGALRWHMNPLDEETVWTFQGGVVNDDDILVGFQAGF